MMGFHAGSPACKPLYIGPPGPSAMGGWGVSMVPPYIDTGIPYPDETGDWYNTQREEKSEKGGILSCVLPFGSPCNCWANAEAGGSC